MKMPAFTQATSPSAQHVHLRLELEQHSIPIEERDQYFVRRSIDTLKAR